MGDLHKLIEFVRLLVGKHPELYGQVRDVLVEFERVGHADEIRDLIKQVRPAHFDEIDARVDAAIEREFARKG